MDLVFRGGRVYVAGGPENENGNPSEIISTPSEAGVKETPINTCEEGTMNRGLCLSRLIVACTISGFILSPQLSGFILPTDNKYSRPEARR